MNAFGRNTRGNAPGSVRNRFFPSQRISPSFSTSRTSHVGRAFSRRNPSSGPRSTTRTEIFPLERSEAIRAPTFPEVSGSISARIAGEGRSLRSEITSFRIFFGRGVTPPELILSLRMEAISPISTNEMGRSPGAFFVIGGRLPSPDSACGRIVRNDDWAASLARKRPTHSWPPGEAATAPNILASLRSPSSNPRSKPCFIASKASRAAASRAARIFPAVSFPGVGASRIAFTSGRAKRRASSSVLSRARASQFRRGTGRPPAAKSRAAATACFSAEEDGTNSSAHPSDTAVLPSTGSPLTQISAAPCGPIRRGRRCIPPYPGMIPSFTSGCPRRAFSVTIR